MLGSEPSYFTSSASVREMGPVCGFVSSSVVCHEKFPACPGRNGREGMTRRGEHTTTPFQNFAILVEGWPPQKKLSRVMNQLRRHDEKRRNVITRAISTNMEKDVPWGGEDAMSSSVPSFVPFLWRTSDIVMRRSHEANGALSRG